MSKHRFIAISLILAATACHSEPPPSVSPETPSDPAGPLTVGPARGVDVATHAVLAFRPDAAGFEGGYTTHHATVRDGIVEVTPYTFTGREREAREPMVLETTSITVEDTQIGRLTGTRLDNGTVILERDQIEERLRNDPDGLHQEWEFASQPAVLGDIVVEISVSGHAYAATTDGGLHFTSPTGAGMRYSHAVWRSADGSEWAIPAVFDGGRIHLTVPDSVVDRTVFPAVLDPTVTAEASFDTPVTGPTGTNTQNPAIAFNGTQYLVVWEDERNSTDSDIWGSRLDAAGTILDPLGIQIAAAPGKQRNPAVAYNGTAFVVAWEDFKVANGTEADIDAATVSNAGAVTALPAVAATGANEIQPALAGGGGTALLTWNSGGTIRGAINTGTFGASFAITATAAASPAVALNPAGNYLVVWADGAAATADIRGQLVTPAGALSGAAIAVSAAAGQQAFPAASFDGTNYDVVWINNSGGLNISGTRVSTAGTVLDTHTEGMVAVGGVVLTGATARPDVPSIACLATGCALVWQERRNLATTGFDVYGQLLNPNFTVNGAEVVISNANLSQFAPQVTAAGSAFFTTWFDTRDGETNTVFGGTLSSAGAVGAAHFLASGNNRESNPGLGIAGNTFGVFWTDSRTLGNDLRFVRFNVNGSKLDVNPLVAISAANAQLSPAASTDLGTNTLLVWADTRNGLNHDIFGARISTATGASADGSGFAISTAANDQLSPAVASSGTVALVVWQDRRNATFDIFGALVNSSGAIVLNDIAICTDAVGNQGRPAVTWNAATSQFLVVWTDDRSGTSHIFGARVSSAGAVLDANGIAISNGAVGQFSAAIASDATSAIAVWEDRKLGQDIFGTRLTGGASLVVGDPNGIAISTAAGGQFGPKIASLGTSYVVGWIDSRNTQTDIFGQQVAPAGTLTGTEFVITNTTDNELNLAMLKGPGNNQARVAYESQRQNTSRVSTRLITTTSPGGAICTSAAQCSTGFCVDGRCCNTACGNGAADCQACSLVKNNVADGQCLPLPVTSLCRNYASTFCDVREYCDGVNPLCPADVGQRQGQVCQKSTNTPPGTGTGICPSNAAPGPHSCN